MSYRNFDKPFHKSTHSPSCNHPKCIQKKPVWGKSLSLHFTQTLVSELRWSYLSRPPLIQNHSFALFDHQNVMFVCSFIVKGRLQSLAVIMRLHCLFTVSLFSPLYLYGYQQIKLYDWYHRSMGYFS